MRVMILVDQGAPIPSTDKGAVQILITYLVNENEKKSLIDLEVISEYDTNAIIKSKKYKNTKFHYVNISQNVKKNIARWNSFIERNCTISKIKQMFMINTYLMAICKHLKTRKDIDVLIIENRPRWIHKISKCTNASLVLYLHNDYLNENTPQAKKILDKLTGVLTVSNFVSDRVKKINKKYSETRIIKIPQAVDKCFFCSSRVDSIEKMKDLLNIEADTIVFLYVGRIIKEKGVLELIRAFNMFEDENVKLLIAGDVSDHKSEYFKQLKREAYKNKDKIIFLGHIAHEKLPIYHAVSDVAVFPSLWNEPANCSLLECVVSGMPVILTDDGGMKEYCPQNYDYIVNKSAHFERDLYLKMKELFQDSLKRKQCSKINREWGKSFTTANHYLKFYQSMCVLLKINI